MNIKLEKYKEKMVNINDGKNITVHPNEPYTTTRLLVGTLIVSETFLSQ